MHTLTFLDILSFFSGFVCSLHKDRAIWPLGKRNLAHLIIFESHSGPRSRRCMSMYSCISMASSSLTFLAAVSLARSKLKPEPRLIPPLGSFPSVGKREGSNVHNVLICIRFRPRPAKLANMLEGCLSSSPRFPIVLSIGNCETFVNGPIRLVSYGL